MSYAPLNQLRLRTFLTPAIQRLLTLMLLACIGVLQGCLTESDPEFTFSGSTMGTSYQIIVVDAPKGVDAASLQLLCENELARVNQLMSNWDPDSELSLFNAAKSTAWTPVAEETIEMLRVAKRISKETAGAYDVTLGSVSELWGFNAGSEGVSTKPEMDDVLTLLYEVGYQLVQESRDGTTIRKLSPAIEVDFSSIAKGHAVDQLGRLLESKGVTRYLAEIGGELRTRGLAADGERWKIGIEWPVAGAVDVPSGISVEDAHVASSGDYRNFKMVDGERISHLIDGRSGYPISHSLAAVTVLHGSVAQADAWATALMVMGEEEGLELANRKGLQLVLPSGQVRPLK